MHKKIAISGKMTSGKSTIAKALAFNHGYKVFSIGDGIKKVSTYLVNNQLNEAKKYLETSMEKEKLEKVLERYTNMYENFKNRPFEKDENNQYIKTETYRELTQRLAAETREVCGESFWFQMSLIKANEMIENGEKVICDDIRLKDEKELFEQSGFKIIRLEIEKEEQFKRMENLYGKINEERLNDKTETALDDEEFDLKINVKGLSVEEIVEEIENKL